MRTLLSGSLLAVLAVSSVALPARAQEAAADVALPTTGTSLNQLNNLTVTNVERFAHTLEYRPGQNYLEMVVTATTQQPACAQPQDNEAVRCLAILQKQYEIRVFTDTQLLARNRTPLTEEIQVGDRINAYGRLEDSSGKMDALILRDLDRPFMEKHVQLDGLRVVSIEQGKDGIQLGAVRGTSPCWDYQTNARLSMPCPMGSQPAPNVRARLDQGNIGIGQPDVSLYYSIAVPRTARVLDANRKAIALETIAEGDTINAYGRLVGIGLMTADTVRVTSRTISDSKLKIGVLSGSAQLETGDEATIALQATGGMSPYSWTATDLPPGMRLETASVINCLVAPCPQPETDQAQLTGIPTTHGTYQTRVEVHDAAGAGRFLQIPITVKGDDIKGLAVSVSTNRRSYHADDTVRIAIKVKNEGDETQTVDFTNGCHADYDVLPGFSLRAVSLCAQEDDALTLKPGASKTYRFSHDLAANPLPKLAFPFDLTVVGRVQNVGEAGTTITVRGE